MKIEIGDIVHNNKIWWKVKSKGGKTVVEVIEPSQYNLGYTKIVDDFSRGLEAIKNGEWILIKHKPEQFNNLYNKLNGSN